MTWLKSKILWLVLRHAASFVSGYLVSKGIVASDSDVEKVVAALTLLYAVAHSAWEKRADIAEDIKKLLGAASVIAVGGVALLLTGCSVTKIAQNGDIINVTSRGFGLRVTATGSTTQTPEVDCGFFAQTVSIVPTSTNTLSSPNFANSASVENGLNPFAVFGNEAVATGDNQVFAGTNSVIKPAK